MAKRRRTPAPPEARSPRDALGPVLAVCAGLVISVFLVYAPVSGFDYVSYDDPTYIVENPMVSRGLSLPGVAWALTGVRGSNWHPLTWLSLMLDVSLFGVRPGASHVVNAVLHAANAVLLFLLLRWLTGALWRSAAVAGLFALHPLHVESVAWIVERKDQLSTLFGLLSIAAYAGWTRHPTPRRYALALGLFALGLLSKSMLVTWPFVLLLLDHWPLRRTATVPWRRLAVEKLPFLALSLASGVVTFLAQRSGGAVQDTTRYPLPSRFANAVVACAEYAWKAFWPHPLAFFYPYPAHVPVLKTLVAAAFLAAVSVLALRQARRAPYGLVGWLFYLGTLVPVLGLVQVGNQRMADRYTYIPFIGLFVAVVWALADRFAASAEGRRALGVVAGAALCVFAILASGYVSVWKGSVTLYEHAIVAVPDNHPAHLNLGTVLYFLGRREEAVAHFREVVRILPEWAVGYHNLGASLLGTGSAEEAERYLAESVRLMPSRADYRVDLAGALKKRGRTDEAVAQLEQALKLEPGDSRARASLAQLRLEKGGGPEALAAAGSYDEAALRYREALRVDPDDARLHNNLAAVYLRQGKLAEGLAELTEAVRLEPGHTTSRFNLGNGLIHAGRTDEGVAHLIEVLRTRDEAASTIRVKAAGVLAEAGPKASAAAPALRELRDRDPGARDAAIAALRSIGAEP
jgi:tetratricopeptide (TPR) repeat protein